MNAFEDAENSNNFNFFLYIKSYIPKFIDIDENKFLKILHIYMKTSFMLNLKFTLKKFLVLIH